MTILKKLFFSIETKFVLIAIIVISVGTATVIENDFGPDVARILIYHARWFEILLFLLMANLVANIIKYRLWRKEKRFSFLFHISFLIILLGAEVTHYTGHGGSLHFREGETTTTFLSDKTYLKISVRDGDQEFVRMRPLLLTPGTRNRFTETVDAGDEKVIVRYAGFIPGAEKSLIEDPSGSPILLLSLADGGHSREKILRLGEKTHVEDVSLVFGSSPDPDEKCVRIQMNDDRLTLVSSEPMTVTSMRRIVATEVQAQKEIELMPMTLYRIGPVQMVLKSFYPRARVQASVPDLRMDGGSAETERPDALTVDVTAGGRFQRITLFGGGGLEGEAEKILSGSKTIALAYGSRRISLPFGLTLADFRIDRYPGSDNPSSYASEVIIQDPEKGLEKNYRIYMNHILKYRGYRFFQASYDQDEKGSILTVSYDPGTPVVYLGFLVLVISLAGHLFHPGSRFRQLGKNLAAIPAAKSLLIILSLGMGTFLFVPPATAQTDAIDAVQFAKSMDSSHSRFFGRLPVQDFQGRIKPVNTLAHEFLHTLGGGGRPLGLSPDQIALSLFINPDAWKRIPMIPVRDPMIRNVLGVFVKEKTAAYLDFFDAETGSYKLANQVQSAQQKSSKRQDALDKELIRLDEILHECSQVFHGSVFRFFPMPADTAGQWLAYGDVMGKFPESARATASHLMNNYILAVNTGIKTGSWEQADRTLLSIQEYQRTAGADILPANGQIRAEILYNGLALFQRLGIVLALGGVLLLVWTLIHRFTSYLDFPLIGKVLFYLLVLGFFLQTAGLVLRWIASGHAPWTNKYESMIFIAWATMLAGVLFSRRDAIILSTAGLWSGLILLVSHIARMNPQITTLPPVLKSYWLIIHVSVITSSYGFFSLSMLLGFVTLWMTMCITERSTGISEYSIQKLTWTNERVITIGLVLVTIGNLFGAVWANESWGRYWGWDPKETWTLITILVYAALLHLRLIPGLKKMYFFNVAAMLAFPTILMTYLGVNFYLSGLHSYAGGKPVPVPGWIVMIGFTLCSVIGIAFPNRKLSFEERG